MSVVGTALKTIWLHNIYGFTPTLEAAHQILVNFLAPYVRRSEWLGFRIRTCGFSSLISFSSLHTLFFFQTQESAWNRVSASEMEVYYAHRLRNRSCKSVYVYVYICIRPLRTLIFRADCCNLACPPLLMWSVVRVGADLRVRNVQAYAKEKKDASLMRNALKTMVANSLTPTRTTADIVLRYVSGSLLSSFCSILYLSVFVKFKKLCWNWRSCVVNGLNFLGWPTLKDLYHLGESAGSVKTKEMRVCYLLSRKNSTRTVWSCDQHSTMFVSPALQMLVKARPFPPCFLMPKWNRFSYRLPVI